MKIAQVVCVYPPYRGGIGRVAEDLHRLFRQENLPAIVYTPAYQRGRLADPAVKRLWPSLKHGNAAWLPQLFWRLLTSSTIVLHYPFFGAAEFVYLVKMIFRRKRLLVWYHMDAQPGGLAGFLAKLYKITIFPLVLKAADRIFVSSEDYAHHSDLVKYWPLVETKVSYLPLGVGEEWLGDLPARFAPRKDIKLLFVGGLDQAHHFKGLSVLLKALAGLTDNFSLQVVGSGNLRPLFADQAKELGIEKEVVFLGNLGPEQLREVYRNSNFLVLPSTSQAEAFGLVLIEAMSQGTPVIASDLPGVRTVVEEGVTGYLAKPDSVTSLRAVLLKAGTRLDNWAEMSAAAKTRARAKYNWSKNFSSLKAFVK